MKKFYGNNSGGHHNGSITQFYPHGGYTQSQFYDVSNTSQNNGTQQSMSQPYNPNKTCQIYDRKGHSALNCFQHGCQICHRVGYVAATCFDRNKTSPGFPGHSSQGFSSSMLAQMTNGQYGPAHVWNLFGFSQGMFLQSQGSLFQPSAIPHMYHPNMTQSHIPLAM